MDPDDLEKRSHPVASGQPIERTLDLFCTGRIGARQSLRPSLDSKADEPLTLGKETCDACTDVCGRRRHRFEIDMAREVLLARIGKGRDKAVPSHRLQRIARTRSGMTIVDDYSDPSLIDHSSGNGIDSFIARWRCLDNLAVTVEREPSGGDQDPALHAADMLPDRKCVEEFVGNEQQRLFRQFLDALMPMRVRYPLLLHSTKRRACLDEVGIALEARRTHHSKSVSCKSTSARPQLRVNRLFRSTRALPAIGKRCADHFAEHLADLGSSREVTLRSKRIARRIIISVAAFHEGFEANRSLGRNAFPERALERGHATEAVPTVASTRTRRFAAVSMR